MGQRSRTQRTRWVVAWFAVVLFAALPLATPIEDAKGDGAAGASDGEAEQPELMLQADPVDQQNNDSEQANGHGRTDPADRGNTAEHPGVPGDGDDGDRIHLASILSNVYMNASIHFDENGEERGRSDSMYINVSIIPPEGTTVLKYRIEKYHDLVTSTGEKIDLSDHHHHASDHWQDFQQHHHNNQRHLRMSVRIDRPRIPAQRINRVAADLELKISNGPKMRVELSPIEKYFDKDIRIKNIEDCRLRIERKGQDRLRVEYRGKGWDNLEEVTFYNQEENKINSHGWSSGSREWGYYREYRLVVPDDGKIVFDIWQDVRVRPGRFEIEDVPLPGSPSPQDQVDVSLREPHTDAVRA
jgi:hypothetical protein